MVHRSGPLVMRMLGLKAMATWVWSNMVMAASGGSGVVFSLKLGYFGSAALTHSGRR